MTTEESFKMALAECRKTFELKMHDYGTSWRVLRPPSITDQIFIKACRIRNIQEKQIQKVEEGVRNEFVAIVNYSIMALIQLELPQNEDWEISHEKALALYDSYAEKAFLLMDRKNHDYGEAWRQMRISSITDIILQKIMRVKQIEDNDEKLLASEGLAANYYDMLNYAVFVLIRI
jgi:hypothetical protein